MKALLVFGDSIIFGRGDNKRRGWVGRLHEYFEANDFCNVVYNLGIPGDTSTSLLARIESECHARRGSRIDDEYSIIVGIGINDSKSEGSPDNPMISSENFRENMQKIIKIAKANANSVVFVGLTPVDEKKTKPYENTYFDNNRIKELNALIENICRDKDVPFIDVYSALDKGDAEVNLIDGLHPNAKGYELLFGTIKDKLIELRIINKEVERSSASA